MKKETNDGKSERWGRHRKPERETNRQIDREKDRKMSG